MSTTFDQALQLHVGRFDRVSGEIRKILLASGYDNQESPEMKALLRHLNESVDDIFRLKCVISETKRLSDKAPDATHFTCVSCHREFTDGERVEVSESKIAQSAQRLMPECRLQPMAFQLGSERRDGQRELIPTCWKCWDSQNIPVSWVSGKRISK